VPLDFTCLIYLNAGGGQCKTCGETFNIENPWDRNALCELAANELAFATDSCE